MRQILPFIYLNEKIVDQKSARISIFNEGFLYGIGIFTTIKVRKGYLLFLEHHFNRLQTNSRRLGLLSKSPLYFKKAAYATIKKNKLIDGGIRITITPTVTCIHTFTTDPDLLGAIRKIAVITTPDTRDIYKTIKTTYRVPHLLAQQQAEMRGAQDALFTQNNKLVESTNANIFAYTSNNIIITPPIKKGLNGITRQILMENLPIQEAPIPQNTTGPLILINSLSLRIVESINGKNIKQNPEFTKLIHQTLDEAEKNYITSKSF